MFIHSFVKEIYFQRVLFYNIHVCVRGKCFCSSLDEPELRDSSAQPAARSEERPLQNGSLEQEEEEEDKDEDGRERVGRSEEDPQKVDEDKPRQKKKFARLSRLRRRRCAHKSGRGGDESDLSEGFESEEDEDDDADPTERADSTGGTAAEEPLNPSAVKKEAKREPLGEEVSWGSGSEEEEEGGTAFDVETDSDMNSQESRSDLEDIEDAENSEHVEGQARDNQEEEDDEEQPKDGGGERDGETPPATNGPLLPSDASISSNLQAMSSQLFQAKRCFRLAPTFSNMLLRPQASTSSGVPTPTDTSAPPSQETPPPPGALQCDPSPGTANGTNDNGMCA